MNEPLTLFNPHYPKGQKWQKIFKNTVLVEDQEYEVAFIKTATEAYKTTAIWDGWNWVSTTTGNILYFVQMFQPIENEDEVISSTQNEVNV